MFVIDVRYNVDIGILIYLLFSCLSKIQYFQNNNHKMAIELCIHYYSKFDFKILKFFKFDILKTSEWSILLS